MNPEKVKAPHFLTDRCQVADIWTIGDIGLLNSSPLAFFCSVKCPGHLILKTYDLAQQLKEKSVPVISGFHSPVEKAVLTTLLRGNQPVLICPARSIHNMRIPQAWQDSIEAGQLLILSPFEESQSRVTSTTALQRNRFVAAMAKQVFITYAEPSGKTEQFCLQILDWNIQLLTFDTEDNQNLLNLGAIFIQQTNILD